MKIENNKEIWESASEAGRLNKAVGEVWQEQIAELKARIAELEAQLKAKAWVDRPMRDPTERYELTNDEWCAETDDTNAPPCGWIGLEP